MQPSQTLRQPILSLLTLLLALIAAGYGAGAIVDTDAWMHLSLGRFLAGNGFPEFEPFVFSAPEEPFFYSSWLFAVVIHQLYLWSGMAGLVVFKMACVGALYALLYRYTLGRSGPVLMAFALLLLSLLWVSPRFVLRPDLLFFLFLVSSLYLVERSRDRLAWLLGLPLVFCLWANIHSSVVLGVIPLGYLVLYHFFDQPNSSWQLARWKKRQWFSFCLLCAAIASTLLNPNGAQQFLYGADVVGLDFFKEEIAELLPPTWEEQKEHMLFALGVFLLQGWLALGWWFKRRVTPAQLADLLVVLFMLALFFYSRRFLYPMLILVLPLLLVQFHDRLRRLASLAGGSALRRRGAMVSVLLVAGLLLFLMPAPRFEANLAPTPDKALKWLDQKGASGDLFNTFSYGGYLVWKAFPERKVFIDPRGKIPLALMEQNWASHNDYSVMTALSDRFGFSYAVLRRKVIGYDYPDADYNGFPNPDWALVYWDNETLVLARRDRVPDSLLASEYRVFSPATMERITTRFFRGEQGARLLQEVQRNLGESETVDAQVGYAVYLISRQRFVEAEQYLSPLLSSANPRVRIAASYMMAGVYRLRGQFDEARRLYESTLESVGHLTGALLELAGISVAQKEYQQAHRYIDELLAQQPDNLKAINTKLAIFNASQAPATDPGVSFLIDRRERLQNINRMLNSGAQAYSRGELGLAKNEFERVLEMEPRHGPALYNMALVAVAEGDSQAALSYYEQAALNDSSLVAGYYHSGRIMQEQGDLVAAFEYFQRYLNEVDRGRMARDARRQIQLIEQQEQRVR